MPFAITIDYQTVEDNTATLRERDSTAQASERCAGGRWRLGSGLNRGGHASVPACLLNLTDCAAAPPPPSPPTPQVRVPLAELPGLVRRLTDMELSWAQVAAQYPAQAPASED